MSGASFLFQDQVAVNDDIKVMIPSVGEILADEQGYYSLVQIVTGMPIDFMVMLDDAGIDFTEINEYELFLLLFPGLKSQDTHLLFGDLDLTKFEIAANQQNDTIILLDREHDIVIDRAIHQQIAGILRKIHHLEKDTRKPGNEAAKQYMIERARKKLRRKQNRKEDSQLEQLIVAMVNTEQYKFDFEGTKRLSIFQFNTCVRQIIKKVDYDHRMFGVYMGTVNAKELSQDDLNWLTNK